MRMIVLASEAKLNAKREKKKIAKFSKPQPFPNPRKGTHKCSMPLLG
jgi:hypothetical protein